jgi:hypothetical protein
VAPQEKDLVLVVQERGDRDRRLAKEVVIEMTAVRQFHIGEIQTEPLVRVHGFLTDGVPTQGEVLLRAVESKSRVEFLPRRRVPQRPTDAG